MQRGRSDITDAMQEDMRSQMGVLKSEGSEAVKILFFGERVRCRGGGEGKGREGE